MKSLISVVLLSSLAFPAPVPPGRRGTPTQWQFMGCRPSPSECHYSFWCSPRKVEYAPEFCEEKGEYPLEKFACYCLTEQ